MSTVNLADYATAGQLDGTDDVALAFQDAINAAGVGGTVLCESTHVLNWTGEDVAFLLDGQTVDWQDALNIKTSGYGYYVALVANRVGDITLKNGRFQGDLTNDGALCVLASNRGSNITVDNLQMDTCVGAGHTFDLCGVDGATFTNCVWRGAGGSDRAEAIEIDQSRPGLLSYADAGQCDGSMTRNVLVQDCQFLPLESGGIVYPSPEPVGSHSAAENHWYENITLRNLTVVDPFEATATGGVGDNSSIRGVFHFMSVKGLTIDGLDVTCSAPILNRLIFVQGRSSGTRDQVDWNEASTTGSWPVPVTCDDILISNVSVNGMSADTANPLICVSGTAAGQNQNVSIQAVASDSVGAPVVHVRYADDVNVDINAQSTGGVLFTTVSNLSLSGSMTDVVDPITLDAVDGFTVGPMMVESATVHDAVIVFSGGTDQGTIYQVRYIGYQALVAGNVLPAGVVVDGSGNGADSFKLGRRMVFTVWDKNYVRKGQIGKLISADVTLRHNAPGDCELTVSAKNNRVADLSAPGARVTMDYFPDDGVPPIRFSGMVTNIHGEGRAEQAVRTFTVTDDWNLLNTTLAWPNPSGTDSQQGEADAYYTVSGYTAEGLTKRVVKANAVRLGLNLSIPASSGRGDVIPTMTFRMHPIADRLFPKVDQAGIGVRIVQVGDRRELQVYEPATYPRVLSEDSKVIQGGSFDLSAATVTRLVEAAGGEGTDRFFKSFTAPVEATLGTVLEQFQDARDIPKWIGEQPNQTLNPNLDALTQQRADETFLENAAKASMDLELVERGSFRFGQTFQLGDRISVQMNQGPVITDLVRSVQLSVGAEGLKVTPVVGDWSDSTNAGLQKIIAQMAKSLRDLKRR